MHLYEGGLNLLLYYEEMMEKNPVLLPEMRARKSRQRASQYRELFEKWVEPTLLPSLLPTDVDDNQGWLLKTNKNRNCGVEKPVAAGDSLICGESVSWPRARLLPEVDLYALPYTVPF